MKLSIPFPILTKLPWTPVLGLALFLPMAASQAAVVSEIEGNNLVSTAQYLSSFSFSSDSVANITLSTAYKHLSIQASGDGTVDWYAFNHQGGRLILDIDGGMPAVNLELGLWDTSGLLVANNDDGGILDLGTAHVDDSYIDLPSLSSGFYYIGVSSFPSAQANDFDIGGSGFTTDGYTLNISSGAVPEPTSMMLVLFSGLTLSLRRRR